MNYQQTIEYLFSTLPMFSRMGSDAFRKDLTNTRILCEHLGNPQQHFKSIHIAGTNGKGSVSHMLAAILQTAGYKTGLYTSPHLYDFRERIRLNGNMVDEDFVVRFVEKTKLLAEEIRPSFFEITVAMAFEYFAKEKVEVAIIEVGLGGRIDSTNIITPELSVITNIGWDHMNLLGDTLEAIAAEKGGIIKPGVPVVVGERQIETVAVFQQQAADNHTMIQYAEDAFQVQSHHWKDDHLYIEMKTAATGQITSYVLQLPGIYQLKNLRTVLMAVQVMNDLGIYKILPQHIQQALPVVKTLTGLYGRWEMIHHAPRVVLEVAHNTDGVKQMLLHLDTMQYRELHIICGMVKDKEVESVLSLFPKNALYYFTQASIPRALDAELLLEKAAAFSLHGQVFENVNIAISNAIKVASPEDLVIVCGSIFLVAEVDWNLDSGLTQPV